MAGKLLRSQCHAGRAFRAACDSFVCQALLF